MNTQLCACGCGRELPDHNKGRRARYYDDSCRPRPPITRGPDHPRYRPLDQRFWEKVEKTDNCWLWTGTKNVSGFPYGMVGVNGTNKTAHRVSYELTYGAIPEGMNVLHQCDNPSCVRPDHLFLGTQKDNVQDMVRKGRRRGGFETVDQNGEGNKQAKLTAVQVREIRDRYAQGNVYMAQLSEEYNVNVSQISMIISRKAWSHIA